MNNEMSLSQHIEFLLRLGKKLEEHPIERYNKLQLTFEYIGDVDKENIIFQYDIGNGTDHDYRGHREVISVATLDKANGCILKATTLVNALRVQREEEFQLKVAQKKQEQLTREEQRRAAEEEREYYEWLRLNEVYGKGDK